MNSKCVLLWLFGISGFAGCHQGWEADYTKLELVTISGRVTLDGQPLANATILFECPDKTFSYGQLDDGGNYTLMFNSEKRGVLPGPKIVRIKTGKAEEEPIAELKEKINRLRPDKKSSIPACYGSRSTLAVIVGNNSRTLNFDLKSDCSVKGPTL